MLSFVGKANGHSNVVKIAALLRSELPLRLLYKAL
jgi:hypothetical protein